jgi:hypothetical protein
MQLLSAVTLKLNGWIWKRACVVNELNIALTASKDVRKCFHALPSFLWRPDSEHYFEAMATLWAACL